jgi:hypothetical protein
LFFQERERGGRERIGGGQEWGIQEEGSARKRKTARGAGTHTHANDSIKNVKKGKKTRKKT